MASSEENAVAWFIGLVGLAVFCLAIYGGRCLWLGSAQASTNKGRETELERKIADLEKQLAAASTNGIDANRAGELRSCLLDAELAYLRYAKLNGRMKRDGTIWARDGVWQQAARDKANAIEECKTTWGR